MTPQETPIIIALDIDSATEARSLVERLGDSVSFYKVGMELYAAAGSEFVRASQSPSHIHLDPTFRRRHFARNILDRSPLWR